MTRLFPAAAVVAVFVLGAQAAYAQTSSKEPRATRNAFPAGSIEGRVLDDQHAPIAGAMVSVIGRTTAAASTDRDGRYTLRELPFGPYILSVHSRGYFKSRGRTIQLTTTRTSVPEIQLARAGAPKAPVVTAEPVPVLPIVSTTQLAGFSIDAAQPASTSEDSTYEPADESEAAETAWRLRHLPRSILKEVASDAVWADNDEEPTRWLGNAATLVPIAFFSDLPLSGQVNLMTIESFQRPGEIFNADAARNVAFVSVNTQAAGGAWSMQGAMTQGDLSSWIVAGSYKSIESANHAYEMGLSYSTQQYDGGNLAALGAIRDSARNVGSVYGYDEWTLSPRLVLGYGTGYARYDYLGGPGVWSPRLSFTVPLDGFRVKALASQRALVPGAEEFAPSVTGVWLPPERTFSSLAADGRFTAEQTRHLELSIERDLAPGVTVSLRGFDQQTTDQLVEIFDAIPGRAETPLGHYYVATAGNFDARGWGVGMTHEIPGYLRGSVEYTVTAAYWSQPADGSMVSAIRSLPLSAERVHDLRTSIETTIPQTATRLFATYRVNSAFSSIESDGYPRLGARARFNVRVNQSLPFLSFSNADWEALVDIRNLFRESAAEASIYDEALAIRAPKRIVGGLLVKF
ncbi:MAG TPA: TonB-dependent receptor [Vicinamibacterales bacterium]|nr:TonB-dependent receptor [Vicinamibacterales bacterium]